MIFSATIQANIAKKGDRNATVSSQIAYLQKNYGDQHLVLSFDPYEEEDANIRANFSKLLKILDKAKIRYENKTSSKLMQ
jgi:hypothetical protein